MSDFSFFVQKSLDALFSGLLPLEDQGVELEESSMGLKIILPDQKIYVIHGHLDLQQLWVSSPLSGGWHFVLDPILGQWKDTRGHQTLEEFFLKEFHKFELPSFLVRIL